MTANEMWTNTEILVDRMDSSGSPGYEDSEASFILTKAQEQYRTMMLSPLTNPKGEGIEESEVRKQGFSALITPASLTPSANSSDNLPNGQFVDLPTNFMHALSEECTLSKLMSDATTYYRVGVNVVSHDEYTHEKKNPFKRPYAKYDEGSIWRMQMGRTNDGNTDITARTAKRHELLTDGTFTVSTYHLRYLKELPEIVVDYDTSSNQRNCILDDFTHQAIIEIASKLLRTAVDRQTIPNGPSIETLE
jgi:hypothetical protein